MKRNKLLLLLAIVVVLTMVLAACTCNHEEYGEWSISVTPDMTKGGKATRQCLNCREPEEVDIPALSDTTVWTKSTTESEAPTHEAQGKDVYTSVYGKVTITLDLIGHTFDQSVVEAKFLKQAATCTTKAVYFKSCECGQASATETFEHGDVLGHDATHHPAVAATCTTDGTKEHWTCSREEGKYFTSEACDTEVEDGIVIPALGHDAGTGEITIVTEPTLDTVGSATFTCVREDCPVTDKAVTVELAKLSDTTVWTVKTTPADYEHPETTTYTHKTYATIVITTTDGSALALPYAGKTYAFVRVGINESKTNGVEINSSHRGWATFNATGTKIKGSAWPFNTEKDVGSFDSSAGSVIVNATTTLIDLSDGIMIYMINNTDVIVMVPMADIASDATDSDKAAAATAVINSVTASSWNGNLAITCSNGAETYGIYTNSLSLTKDVTFADENGTVLAADACRTSVNGVVVSKDTDIVAAFSMLGDSLVQYQSYTNEANVLKVYTNGAFALGTKTGTYTVNKDETLDAYVMDGENKVEHYTLTLSDDGTYTLADVKVEITFVAGEQGTLEQTTQSLFVGCVISVVPTVNNPETTAFVGWYTSADADIIDDTAVTVAPNKATTLYAQYSTLVTYHVVDALGGDHDIAVPSGQSVLAKLPQYTNETINSANNTIFTGWQYTTVGGQTGTFASDSLAAESDDGMTLTAVWNAAGRWNAFKLGSGATTPTYDAKTKTWKIADAKTSLQYFYFEAIGGDIKISFKYYISGNKFGDTITIKKGNETLGSIATGQTAGASTPKEISTLLKKGETITISLKYDTPADGHGIYFSDLVINGREITVAGEYDMLEGAYTCESKDSLVLDGFGNFTLGELSGTYTVDTANRNSIVAKVIDDGNIVGQYNITLDGETYTAVTPQVTVTYHYGIMGNGDKLGESASSAVDVYSLIELPTPAAIEGHVFLGWFTGVYSSSKQVTEIRPGENTDIYARYAESVTVTYHHNVSGAEDKVVAVEKGKAIGDFMYKMPDDLTVAGKAFVGWFKQDGTTTGEWGDEVTSATTVSADMEVYGRWEVPNILAGTYKGYEIYRENKVGTNKNITIDLLGKATGTKSGAVIFDEKTGFGKIGSRLMYADVSAKVLIVSDGSETAYVSASNGHDAHFLFAAETVTLDAKNIISWNSNKSRVVMFVVDGQNRWIYVDENDVAVDVSVVITDASGNTVTDNTKYKTYGNVLSITNSNGLNVSKVYNGTSWGELDGYQGEYTDAVLGTIVLDGISKATVGDTSYTYSIVSDGIVSVVINGQYYEISNMSAPDCTLTAFNANVTYSIEHGKLPSDVNLAPSANVEIVLPTPIMDEGWLFFGWRDASENKVTSYTFSKGETVTFTALVLQPAEGESLGTAKLITITDDAATVSVATNENFQTHYDKLVLTEKTEVMFKATSRPTYVYKPSSGSQYNARLSIITYNETDGVKNSLGIIAIDTSSNTTTIVLEAGTYYIESHVGGKVTGSNVSSSSQFDGWGSYTYYIYTNAHSVPATALKYTLGTEQTVEEKNGIIAIYEVTLAVGEYEYTMISSLNDAFARAYLYALNENTGALASSSTSVVNSNTSKTATVKITKAGKYYIKADKICTFKLVDPNQSVDPNPSENTIFAGKTYSGQKQTGMDSHTTYEVVFNANGTAGTIKTAVYEDGMPTMDTHTYQFASVTVDATAKTVTLQYTGGDIVATYTDKTIVFPSDCILTDLRSITVTTSESVEENPAPVSDNPFAGKTFKGKYLGFDEYGFDADSSTNMEVVFNDSSTISGTLKSKGYTTSSFDFTATLDGTTITFTFTSGGTWAVGKTLIGNISGNKITFAQGTYSDKDYGFWNQGSVSCEDFSL